jgi:hypothetical protein
MTYDGSIRIDTKIDESGFNKGTRSMSDNLKSLIGVLGKVAAAIGVAFSVVAVVRFSTACLNLAADFYRLQLAAQAVGAMWGYSADQVKSLTQQLVDQGIQTDVANQAFIQMARNGLDANLLPALARGSQDLAVFASQGETSSDILNDLIWGIMTMNELMLRRHNVSIDITTAEKEYGKTLGKTVEQMSVYEKQTAVALAVLEKLKGVQGLYAVSQKTAAGQMQSNIRIMNEFRAAIGAPFQGALFTLVKGFNDLIKVMTAALGPGGRFRALLEQIAVVAGWLIGVLVSVFKTIASLFGVSTSEAQDTGEAYQDLGDSVGDAADNAGDLATNTGNAGKAAKGALAPFDELNVLQQKTGTGEGGGGGGGGELTPIQIPFDTSGIEQQLSDFQAKVEEFKNRLAEKFGPISEAFERLKIALTPLGQTLWTGLQWAWENILVPMGNWVMNEAVPAFLDLLGGAATLLNSALLALQPLGQWLWDNFLQPLAEWTGDLIISALGTLTDLFYGVSDWIDTHQELFQFLVVLLGSLAAAWWLVNFAVAAWAVIGNLGWAVTVAFAAAWGLLTSPIFLVTIAIAALIAIVYLLIRYWPQISDAAGKAWDYIQERWGIVAEWFRTTVIEPLTTKWNEFTTNLTEGWDNFWNGARDTAKNIINTIIGFINGLIKGALGGINGLIDALNSIQIDIPSWVPLVGGQTFGVSIPKISVPQIPLLAQGAVIPPNAQFLAMLGDQRNGRNLEAPEGLIRQIIQEEIGKIELSSTINFSGSIGELVRLLKPFIDKENVRIGNSLISGSSI